MLQPGRLQVAKDEVSPRVWLPEGGEDPSSYKYANLNNVMRYVFVAALKVVAWFWGKGQIQIS